MVEPLVSQGLILETCVSHAPLAHNGVFGCILVGTMKSGSDDGVLLVRNLRFCSLPYVVVGSQIWSHRDVVPGHEPEAWNVDWHVVVPQAAPIPGRIIGSTLDHSAPSGDGHWIREDSV